MGEFADDVRDRLRDALAERQPSLDWETEHYLRRTPVDVTATSEDDDRFVAVELEWRRADPANNTAKLFYYAEDGAIEQDEIVVCQLFSGYYDLDSGGVSSKREVAEFVGETAAESVEGVSFHPLRLAVDPPKKGGNKPEGWQVKTDEAAEKIASLL
jgi:hypothetical protein